MRVRFLPLILIFVFAAIFITIFPNIFGGFETQHNATALNESSEYRALVELTQADMVIIGAAGTLVVVGLLVILSRVI